MCQKTSGPITKRLNIKKKKKVLKKWVETIIWQWHSRNNTMTIYVSLGKKKKVTQSSSSDCTNKKKKLVERKMVRKKKRTSGEEQSKRDSVLLQGCLQAWDVVTIGTGTHTLACGFFLEKSQARPRSEMRTWPCSSSRIFAGWGSERERERDTDDAKAAEMTRDIWHRWDYEMRPH